MIMYFLSAVGAQEIQLDAKIPSEDTCKVLVGNDEKRECCDKIADAVKKLQCIVESSVPTPSEFDGTKIPPATASHPNEFHEFGEDIIEFLPPSGLSDGEMVFG